MLTRREFVAQLAAAGAAVAALPAKLGAAIPSTPNPAVSIHPVVSIHLDQPYIDVTGRAVPYLPPPGVRAGAPVEHMSEQQMRSSYLYFC